MSNWPVSAASSFVVAAEDALVTGAAASDFFGAWAEVVAAAPVSADVVQLSLSTTHWARTVVQLAVGSTGSEVVIATVPLIHQVNTDGGWVSYSHTIPLPLRIRQGDRISARVQTNPGNTPGAPHRVSLHLIQNAGLIPVGGGTIDAVGLDLATTNGAVLVTGNNNVYSAWVELSASFPRRIRAAAVMPLRGGNPLARRIMAQIGFGPAGSEVPVATGMAQTPYTPYSDGPAPFMQFVPCNIPANSRIVGRVKAIDDGFWGAGVIGMVVT